MVVEVVDLPPHSRHCSRHHTFLDEVQVHLGAPQDDHHLDVVPFGKVAEAVVEAARCHIQVQVHC